MFLCKQLQIRAALQKRFNIRDDGFLVALLNCLTQYVLPILPKNFRTCVMGLL